MKYEVYEDIDVSDDSLEYGFISLGPKGNIKKLVRFENIQNSEVYNLALVNHNADGATDDLTVNDNKDRNKILATVAVGINRKNINFTI